MPRKWSPIQDLPPNWKDLYPTELAGLAEIWKERAESLKDTNSLKEFNERLNREWAIETGIIENLYTLDRGVTQLLIEHGIKDSLIPHGTTNKPVEQVVSLLNDQKEALEGLFDFIKQRRLLSTSYIKELHSLITRNQVSIQAKNGTGRYIEVELLRGEWKKQPNNPTRPDGVIHEYCPPEQVASEMDRLIEVHLKHCNDNVYPEVEAAWLHHRFTQIHPFQDGNGRIARAIASLIFIREGYFPLVINRDLRERYISACEEGDRGDLDSLVELFASIQKRSFIKALGISDRVLYEGEPIRNVLSAAIDRIKERRRTEIEERNYVFQISKMLEDLTYEKIREIANQLINDLSSIQSKYRATAVKSQTDSHHWYRNQIIQIANEIDYYANYHDYSKWIRLKIYEDRQVEILVAFHGLGVEFLRIMAVTSFLEYRDKVVDEDDKNITSINVDGPYKLCDEVFQFSYNDEKNVVLKRFSQWLDKVLVVGLDQWRRQL